MRYTVCRDCCIAGVFLDADSPEVPCPVCGSKKGVGLLFYDLDILIMVDLVQESYQSISNFDDTNQKGVSRADRAHIASVLVFFCTLKEMLLDRFLGHLMHAHKLPEGVRKRLLADNITHTQKLRRLLPSLTGVKWPEILATFPKKDNENFTQLDLILEETASARNDLVHEGLYLVAKPSIATKCITHEMPLLDLFVQLHNSYVYPYYRVVAA